MENRIRKDLAILYQKYAQILLRKQELEVEIRIRQGILELLDKFPEVENE